MGNAMSMKSMAYLTINLFLVAYIDMLSDCSHAPNVSWTYSLRPIKMRPPARFPYVQSLVLEPLKAEPRVSINLTLSFWISSSITLVQKRYHRKVVRTQRKKLTQNSWEGNS